MEVIFDEIESSSLPRRVMKSDIQSQQKDILNSVLLKPLKGSAARCILLSDFPSQWARALSLLSADLFSKKVDHVPLERCTRHEGNEPSILLIDALHNSSLDVLQRQLKALLHQQLNQLVM